MSLRLAFVGFRHGHILDLYRRAQERPDVEVVAACEEDPATREQVAAQGVVKVDYGDFQEMLAEVNPDAIAVGDYYGRRGSLLIKALTAGKHVISDKPICTRLDELDQIEALSARNRLAVGCMLNMRDAPQFIGVRDLLRRGAIGEVQAISFGGQHPLLLGKRASWYFQPGKHGGTINDIAIHALDAIPWTTGLEFSMVNAARCWHAFASGFPHFRDAAQMMLTMENGCGVLGDVSYFAPDSCGYVLPFYWRMTFWGREGVLETSITASATSLVLNGESALRAVPLPEGDPGGYLRSFIGDIQGQVEEGDSCTASVLRAARVALTVQRAADAGVCNLPLEGER